MSVGFWVTSLMTIRLLTGACWWVRERGGWREERTNAKYSYDRFSSDRSKRGQVVSSTAEVFGPHLSLLLTISYGERR